MGPGGYDAYMVYSFGGPEGPDEVIPFLQKVTEGKNVPLERLEEVAENYRLFDGVSPINAQNRQLIALVEQELRSRGNNTPIYFVNRHWHPRIEEALQDVARAGHRRVLAFITSAFGSNPGCRAYRTEMNAALDAMTDAPSVDYVARFHDQPLFLRVLEDRLRDGLSVAGPETHVVFTAHSIPTAMAQTCPYEEQLAAARAHLVDRVGLTNFSHAWQSRSGPPQVPWLEPDIVDHIDELSRSGVTEVAVMPIGFVSDHMEVKYDLDTQAREHAAALGMTFHRIATAGTHPLFVKLVADLLETPEHTPCAPDCCSYTPRRPRV